MSVGAKHKNNFDLLRFLLAFIVFLVHSHVLSKKPELGFFSAYLSSDFAVKAFFVVSGYLIFMSYENSSSLRDYLVKRTRRIYPAYFSIVVLCSIVGLFLSSFSATEYFSLGWLKYLLANLVFLNFLAPSLPGVFTTNPGNVAVNGALWTLKIEVVFYLLVPMIVLLFRKFNRFAVIAIIYVLSISYLLWMNALFEKTGSAIYEVLARQIPGQLCYFMVGALFYYYENRLSKFFLPLCFVAIILFIFSDPWLSPIEPLVLATIVIYFAVGFKYLGNFGKFGDFSYGIYITHFPILQTLIAMDLFNQNAFKGLFVAIMVVLTGAFIFWHLIEKRFLKKSSHYVIADKTVNEQS